MRQALKREKAVGPDGWKPAEVWKFLGGGTVEILTRFSKKLLKSEKVPEEQRNV